MGPLFDPVERRIMGAPVDGENGMIAPRPQTIIAPETGGDLASVKAEQRVQFGPGPKDPLAPQPAPRKRHQTGFHPWPRYVDRAVPRRGSLNDLPLACSRR